MHDGGYFDKYRAPYEKIMNKRPVVIVGGHLSPAVSVLQELLKRGMNECLFIGRMYTFSQARHIESLEYKTITGMGIPFIHLPAPRFLSGNFFNKIIYSLIIIPSFVQSLIVMIRMRPCIVMAFGGYISIPVCVAAYITGIPFIIHEQTTRPGLANKALSRFSSKICVSWKETVQLFPESVRHKIVVTGNPLRDEVHKDVSLSGNRMEELHLAHIMKTDSELPLVFITGGSTGAHRINRVVAESLSDMLTICRVIHQTGRSHYRDDIFIDTCLQRIPVSLQKRYGRIDYLEGTDMIRIMNSAAIIVGRAGANTIVEVALLGKPMICIPLPIASENEQLHNAQKLSSYGSAVIIAQEHLTPASLVQTLRDMAASYPTYAKHASTASTAPEFTVHTKAVRHIVDIARDIIASYRRV